MKVAAGRSPAMAIQLKGAAYDTDVSYLYFFHIKLTYKLHVAFSPTAFSDKRTAAIYRHYG